MTRRRAPVEQSPFGDPVPDYRRLHLMCADRPFEEIVRDLFVAADKLHAAVEREYEAFEELRVAEAECAGCDLSDWDRETLMKYGEIILRNRT